MVLSGNDVARRIIDGTLVFTPSLAEDQIQQNGIDMILEASEREMLSSGQFTLGRTREYIKMPNDLMAFVQLRSTWARKGFMLPPTVIDAGFEGTITLEIVSFGDDNRLPIGQRFAHIIFQQLSSAAMPYRGKYQGQSEITHAID